MPDESSVGDDEWDEKEDWDNGGGIGDDCVVDEDCKDGENLFCNDEFFTCECAKGYVMDGDTLGCGMYSFCLAW